MRADSVSSLSALSSCHAKKHWSLERTIVYKLLLFAAGDLAAITCGCSSTLPASFPGGLFNLGMCML